MYLDRFLTAGSMLLTAGFTLVLVSLKSDAGAIAAVLAFFACGIVRLYYHAGQDVGWTVATVKSMFVTTALAVSYVLTGLVAQIRGVSEEFLAVSGVIGWAFVATGTLALAWVLVSGLWHRQRRSSA